MPTTKSIAIIAGQLVLGGAERQLYLWLAHLDRSRYEPVVVTLHPAYGDHWERPIRELGIDILEIHHSRSRLKRLTAICRKLAAYRPALVHGWHLFASPYAGAAARRIGARASLGSLRGSFESYTRQPLLALLTGLMTDGIVVNSEVAARRLEARSRVFRGRVFAVPNGVESVPMNRNDVRQLLAERWQIETERVWLGSVGRFEVSKQFALLLEVTASLMRQGADLQLVLVGYGEGIEELRQRARVLRIENRVTFTGAQAQARSWIQAFDVFCFTAVDEGLPNVVMEAAAVSVPIVAWRTSFLLELLGDPPAAVVAETGDVFGLQEGLASLIANRGLRESLGQAAQKRVLAKFGVPSMVNRLSAVYDEILGTKQP